MSDVVVTDVFLMMEQEFLQCWIKACKRPSKLLQPQNGPSLVL